MARFMSTKNLFPYLKIDLYQMSLSLNYDNSRSSCDRGEAAEPARSELVGILGDQLVYGKKRRVETLINKVDCDRQNSLRDV